MRRIVLCFGFILAVTALNGCGTSYVPTTGTVTMNGTPVSNAQVVFISDNGKDTFAAVTDDGGKFELNSATGKGALPGTYKVTVIKSPAGMSTMGTAPGDKDYMKDMQDAAKHKGAAPGKGGPPGAGGPMGKMASMAPGANAMKNEVKTELPIIYANGSSTPFKVTIPHEGPVPLDLKGEEKKDKKK